ncbi:26S proteasome regulatory subunit RPN6 [Intoshia linei]|uniref:26S proteasome regulatory subunit RPN6 n=1 Tax=Intoshia linei TaxID=1819745 RepID=A0A177B5J7_9BILA|nr:26S proteasome regulatory subunit RPN6 [Intoshia linei]
MLDIITVTDEELDFLKNNVYTSETTNKSDLSAKQKEKYILKLSKLYSKRQDTESLANLIKFIRPFLKEISKPKAAKLIRCLLNDLLDITEKFGYEVDICLECIKWAENEKRFFLRNTLQSKLIELYLNLKQFKNGIELGDKLLVELKKLDDKPLLVQVQLSLSKIYYHLGNFLKSRGALTSGRTTANGIYCPPRLQASLDMQSGILHSTEENDFKTAYSYFYEAFEGYDSINHLNAMTCLKYMLMSKIMSESSKEVMSIISGKMALKYAGKHIEAMKRIAQAAKNRSLFDFQKVLDDHKEELDQDVVIKTHLKVLYTHMMEQNLIKLVEPFSFVQISHIAGLINLPTKDIERHLSKMILDKKLDGIIDQKVGILEIIDKDSKDSEYETCLTIINRFNEVVDSLYTKANKLLT